MALRSPGNKHYVFYKEEAKSVRMDLAGMEGAQPAVAVDTKKACEEVELGFPEGGGADVGGALRFGLWAIAVGSF